MSYKERVKILVSNHPYYLHKTEAKIEVDTILMYPDDWKEEYLKLRAAVRKLYYSAWYKADREVEGKWENVRAAAQFPLDKESKLGKPRGEPEYKEGDLVSTHHNGVVRLLRKAWFANKEGEKSYIEEARITGRIERGNVVVGAKVNLVGVVGPFVVKAIIDDKAWLHPTGPNYFNPETIADLQNIYVVEDKS